jgi:hypothetical protein
MAINIIDLKNPTGDADGNKDTTITAKENTTAPTPTVVTEKIVPTPDKEGASTTTIGTEKPTIPSILPQPIKRKSFEDSCAYCKTKLIIALAQDAAFVLVLLAFVIYLLKKPKNG